MNNNLKPIQKLSPFQRFCCTIGMIPSSYKTSLTYEEQLLWLCNYLENTILPAINNNAEATAEVQQFYIQLKSYVDNYFSDLNVQEQINNKLDEMAESGELAEIINQEIFSELNNQVTQNTDNILDLISTTSYLQGRKIINYLASEYQTLQDAIDEASVNNDVVFIDENLTINEPDTIIEAKCPIIGLGNAKIICKYIDIVEPNVKIQNLTIESDFGRLININAIEPNTPKNNILIEGCKLIQTNYETDLPYSIVYASADVPINNLQIKNNYIENGGIQLSHAVNYLITDNYMDGKMNLLSQNELIHVSRKSSGIITNNTLINNNYDFIDIYSAGEKTIISNNRMLHGNQNGIECKVVLADTPRKYFF